MYCCFDLFIYKYVFALLIQTQHPPHIPTNISAGAMENYGLVTYREAKVLVNETTSESMKRGIAVSCTAGAIFGQS